MCIALISTAHPDYSLIIIDNRDEFLHRPTSLPDWWEEPFVHVLGSRDLARSTQGTWMGVTRQGKVAVLTNYREPTATAAVGAYSRGRIVNSWLTASPNEKHSTHSFVQAMVNGPEAKSVGGFSLVCGRINEPLAIVSNRSSSMNHITWVAAEKNQTLGLSNTSVDDRSWPKIINGEKLIAAAIDDHVQSQENEDVLIECLLRVLSTDTLPKYEGPTPIDTDAFSINFRKSIFIPGLGIQDHDDRKVEESSTGHGEGETGKSQLNGHLDQNYSSGPYGTQKQTILLAQADGRIRYFERTLYDNNAKAIPIGQGDRNFDFYIEK
ncbi:hypothetical protein N7495_006616 [Penicillium taxi]|uniref:uncharacterized protein n=1 Tax=Penicillium taxi TaxID=168475 RepID=UPI002544D2F1|nr:uncharacterized protein N7495_006616 [Penicillium taxi]KAJ5894925.1 hypothetical protein N7495_006616 [Penicillium taxi]